MSLLTVLLDGTANAIGAPALVLAQMGAGIGIGQMVKVEGKLSPSANLTISVAT